MAVNKLIALILPPLHSKMNVGKNANAKEFAAKKSGKYLVNRYEKN
jgi:hypothetical protein